MSASLREMYELLGGEPLQEFRLSTRSPTSYRKAVLSRKINPKRRGKPRTWASVLRKGGKRGLV